MPQPVPPPPEERDGEHDTEVDKQPANRASVSKKAWAKPTIRTVDDLNLFKSGPHSDPVEENANYYITS